MVQVVAVVVLLVTVQMLQEQLLVLAVWAVAVAVLVEQTALVALESCIFSIRSKYD
jgi:hypothetical protein